ncbi:myo-inosose-2 dehydratase [uncultured Kiloniella sp.]|uniref:myo-inosose-2 dehydratase n=1 Tax=uncultured Kiloniella sp. TaxID=1133091 RepID=UPI00261B6322|nr:myo-inosose-2 dehydratase [uncultured Kiloniella sp.]
MTIRIGANPIGWSNDDMTELGGHIPLEQCLREAQEAGFVGMELGNKFPRKSETLKATLAEYGHSLVSGWYSSELLTRSVKDELLNLRPHLDLLKGCGADVLVFAETSNAIHGDINIPLSKRPVLHDKDWVEFGNRVTEIGDATLAEGVRLVYHHHMGTIVQSEEDIHNFMRVTGPSVHLLLDTGHATWGGADPATLAGRYKDRISHVHTKDIRSDIMKKAADKNMSFLEAVIAGVYTVPGDGMIDFTTTLKELQGYQGWVIVEAEQYSEETSALSFAKLGYANLVKYLQEANLLD